MNAETHSHDGAGFSRLGDLIPATVTITRGTARAVWSARELEARLGVPGLARHLAELLRVPDIHSLSGEAKRGFGGEVKGFFGLPETQNAPKEISERRSERSGNSEGTEGMSDTARATPTTRADNDIDRVAAHLADSLRDWESIVFFRQVARAVPREVIRDALTRALDAPRESVRRSRAALFTHIVRPHLPPSSFTKSPNPC
jgi:hypothetical protein